MVTLALVIMAALWLSAEWHAYEMRKIAEQSIKALEIAIALLPPKID